MEVMERLIYLFRKFSQLKVSSEEYACMKAINFLNQGEWRGGGGSTAQGGLPPPTPSQGSQTTIGLRWHGQCKPCQRPPPAHRCPWLGGVGQRLSQHSRPPLPPPDIRGLTNTAQLEQLNKRYWYACQDFMEFRHPHQPSRFPDLMMCLPEIRYIAGEARPRRALEEAPPSLPPSQDSRGGTGPLSRRGLVPLSAEQQGGEEGGRGPGGRPGRSHSRTRLFPPQGRW